MENTAANKAFIKDMIGQRKRLEDYPGKANENMVVHEPSSFPFGGSYEGLQSFEKFYPQVRTFYDFSRFELLEVYGDGDAVFALIRAGIADTEDVLLLCEHFTFKDGQIVSVRLFLCDPPGNPIDQIVRKQQAAKRV